MYKNDAVLLELTTPVILGRNVTAICLPEHDIEPRQLCVTAGWGVSTPGGKYFHFNINLCNHTKKIRLPKRYNINICYEY